ncbi:MAG: hypothetical protein ACK2U9_07330 [Anaerolineae bacterium]
MSLFEYLMVMVAIVLGLSVTQLLRGLSKIARGHQPFLPLIAWVVALFYMHIQVWWGFWDFSMVDEWTQFGFTFIIVIPCMLFAATELLVPLGSGPETNWREHFISVRVWFYAVLTTFGVVALLASRVMLDVPLNHPYRVVQTLATLSVAAGLFLRKPEAHTWICLVYLGVLITGQVLFRLFPGLGG